MPDELWELAEPLLPKFTPRTQGGGTAPTDERAVFTAVVYVLTSGCAWRLLPPSFDVTVPTAHRRFSVWTKAGLWRRLHRAVLDELGSEGLIDWSRAVIDAASVRAKKGGDLTGPNPVDRGKSGSKIHVLSDGAGIPLAVCVSAANTTGTIDGTAAQSYLSPESPWQRRLLEPKGWKVSQVPRSKVPRPWCPQLNTKAARNQLVPGRFELAAVPDGGPQRAHRRYHPTAARPMPPRPWTWPCSAAITNASPTTAHWSDLLHGHQRIPEPQSMNGRKGLTTWRPAAAIRLSDARDTR
ncbi:IS5 family transposase [Nocardia sp. NPDC059764]|uniref:IS5 family transposase n=1 Tax=Nocardia sp. NPDC059764 TaxID=3346939 RepID=UPI003650EE6D